MAFPLQSKSCKCHFFNSRNHKKSDPIVDLIRKELARITTIKREAFIIPGDVDDVSINVGVDLDVDVGVDVDVDIGDVGGGDRVDDVGGIYDIVEGMGC
uniref:Uncharacterized protein n=1 Tax=Solanum lycopersicum TaxID=4081 RepID=A0A3Q7EVL8_SOLLC